MNSAKVRGPLSRTRAASNCPSGVRVGGRPLMLFSRLLLGIGREHFDDVAVQAVVELLLKGPRELLVLNLPRVEKKQIGVHLNLRREIEHQQFPWTFQK